MKSAARDPLLALGGLLCVVLLGLAMWPVRGEPPVIRLRLGGAVLSAEVAATPAARRRGLMHRQALAADAGMLLVFPEPQIIRLWMKDTPLALDAGFFDSQGRLLAVAEMAPDDGRRIHRSPGPAVYALEMTHGWFLRNGVALGDRLVFLDPLP